ncbi:hypothetical protein PMIN04_007295 [Paraphaeosphaeria minitans]
MGPNLGGVTCALAALAALLPVVSPVPFGLQIYQCTKPGVIAPGFDDGPWIYSEDILDRMQATGFIATWFINGANKGNIYDYNSTLRRMIDMGHQIGSHTWSHKDLATLTVDGIKQEMILLEEAMVNILGYFPYYMRPPFLSVNAQALSVLKELRYHVIIGDLNTKDWEYQTQAGIEIAKKLFVDGLDLGHTIVESHEQEVWSHGVLIDYMIKIVKDRGLKTVTVAECLQDTQVYRTVRDPNAGQPMEPEPTVTYSLNGRCGNINAGGNLGWTCPPNGGRCCSKYGNCGNGADYCTASVCQPAFGLCDAPKSTYRDELSQSNTATTIPSRTVSNTESARATPTPLGPESTTPDGTCGNQGSGKDKGYTCKPGACCSKYGNCGTTFDYCAAPVCQSAFGKCDPAPERGSKTPDGTCGDISKGNNNGYVCKTGTCCSKYGNCGTTTDYCAANSGCQPAFGTCVGFVSSSSGLSTSSPVPSSSGLISSLQSSVAEISTETSPILVASPTSSSAALSSSQVIPSTFISDSMSASVEVSSTSLATTLASSSFDASVTSSVTASLSDSVSSSDSVTSSSGSLTQSPLTISAVLSGPTTSTALGDSTSSPLPGESASSSDTSESSSATVSSDSVISTPSSESTTATALSDSSTSMVESKSPSSTASSDPTSSIASSITTASNESPISSVSSDLAGSRMSGGSSSSTIPSEFPSNTASSDSSSSSDLNRSTSSAISSDPTS